MTKKSDKILYAIQLPAGKVKSERVIPSFAPSKKSGFLGVKAGKAFPHGMVAQLDKPVTAEEVLTEVMKKQKPSKGKKECLEIIERYFEALQAFKPGNVLFIHYSSTGEFSLDKVLDTPPTEAGRMP